MKAWHDRDPVVFDREKAEVELAHPHLHVSTTGSQVRIVGSLEIKEGHKVLDRFSIEIQLPEDYPESVPVVFETGGRIPRTVDRHCYSDTGSACLFLPEERWRVWPKGRSLLECINGPVLNYFISQSVFEHDGVWPFSEWKHGNQGKQQYYRELLGTDDLPTAKKYMEYVAAKKVKGHWDCPCGSRKRVRDCHFPLILELREKIPRNESAKAVRLLEGALANSTN